MILACNPDQLAFATGLTSRRPPRPEMFLVVKASFAIASDGALTPLPVKDAPVSGPTFGPEDVDGMGEVLTPNDFAHAKLHPELIVRGSCHTPKQRPMRECVVGIKLGKLEKRLRVVGRRLWVEDALGGAASEPMPFTSMPITWANAFGGPGHADNPAGKGLAPSSAELPNVELLGQPIQKTGGSHAPAGFGPLNPLWPAQVAKLGKQYGDAWRATRAPFVAEDFDWSYHQSAPRDQWLDRLVGDEVLVLENLHPDASELRVELPKLRVVAYGRKKGGAIEPIAMHLDTVFADLEKGTLALSWRGHVAVRELDLDDVHSLIFRIEPLGGPALPRAEYERDLEAFEADPSGIVAVKQEIEARFRALEGDLPPAPELPSGPEDAVSQKVTSLFPQGSVVHRHVRAAMDRALASPGGEKLLAALAKSEAATADEEPPVPRGQPGVAPSTGLRRRMRPAAEKIAAAKSLPGVPTELRERALEAEERLKGPSMFKADPEYSYPEPLSHDALGPGANLIDRDLTGQDLTGIDLRGAKLDGAVLTRAKLAGANLSGASLRGALLFKTDLAGADLSRADLSRANLARVAARGARFDGATLLETFFQDAELGGATFVDATGSWTVFERAKLHEASFERARFERSDFGEADLTGARCRRADLSTCLLERATLDEAQLEEATLFKCCARGASLKRADLTRASAELASFDLADLSGANLSLATLSGSHLSEAKLVDAEVYGANLRQARLYRADLSGAVLDRANLLDADLVRTRLDRTSFKNASLFGAKLLDAAGEGTDFSGANLEECVYEKARRPEQVQ